MRVTLTRSRQSCWGRGPRTASELGLCQLDRTDLPGLEALRQEVSVWSSTRDSDEGRQEGLGFQAEEVGTQAEARPLCGRGAHLMPHPSHLGGWPPDSQEGNPGTGRTWHIGHLLSPVPPPPRGPWRPSKDKRALSSTAGCGPLPHGPRSGWSKSRGSGPGP